MNRSNQNGERGGSKLSLILTLIIVVALGFTAVKIVPVYVENYQFQDSIEAESRFALTGYPKKNVDDIRDDVLQESPGPWHSGEARRHPRHRHQWKRRDWNRLFRADRPDGLLSSPYNFIPTQTTIRSRIETHLRGPLGLALE